MAGIAAFISGAIKYLRRPIASTDLVPIWTGNEWAMGPAATSTLTAASIALAQGDINSYPARPSTHTKQLFKAVIEGMASTGTVPDITRPANNLVAQLDVGDSVGEMLPQFVTEKLRGSLGFGGSFFSTPVLSGGAVTVSPGPNAGPYYWVNGTWISLPAGGVVTHTHAGGRPVCDDIRVYYVKRPGAGTFKVQINTGSGFVDAVGYTNVSADAAVVGLGIITLAPAYGQTSVQVVGLTGFVETPPVAAWINHTDGGLATFRCGIGGLPITTMNATHAAIKWGVFNDVSPDFAMMEFKDDANYPTDFATFMDGYRANVTKPTDWILLGSSPEGAETPGQPGYPSAVVANNNAMRAYAIAHSLCYFDGYGVFKNYATMVAYGWQGDATHRSTAASAYSASVLWNWLGLEHILKTPLSRSVRLAQGDTLNIQTGSSIGFAGSSTYPLNTISHNANDLVLKPGRSMTVQQAGGTTVLNVGVGNSAGFLTVNALVVGQAASAASGPPTNGPCIRALGTANDSGAKVSGVAPGDGSAVGPLQALDIRLGASGLRRIVESTASPEGVITAGPGVLCLGADGHLYFKATGTGNTGWVVIV